jgi:hypothetical protein
MKFLVDDLFCSMIMVNNPETAQPEIIMRFTNFNTEQEAVHFVQMFKKSYNYNELLMGTDEKITVH